MSSTSPGTAPSRLSCGSSRPPWTPPARRILSKEWSDAAGSQGWYLLHNSSLVQFSRIRNGVWNNASRAALTPGTRYHVAVTYDGTTMRLYVDGALAGSGASAQALVDGPAVFTLGARAGGGGPFLGTIDEPAVYDGVALTPSSGPGSLQRRQVVQESSARPSVTAVTTRS